LCVRGFDKIEYLLCKGRDLLGRGGKEIGDFDVWRRKRTKRRTGRRGCLLEVSCLRSLWCDLHKGQREEKENKDQQEQDECLESHLVERAKEKNDQKR